MTPPVSPVSRKLVCHPQTPSPSVDAIAVRVENTNENILALSFVLHGDLDSLRVPAQRPCRRVDELWRHTCFEAFLMTGDGPGYQEYNFSPSGEWAAYQFSRYRHADVAVDEPVPVIEVHRSVQSIELKAEIALKLRPTHRSIRLGLSAVVEAADGDLSYWALRHPPGRPDFHHADAFALQLDLC